VSAEGVELLAGSPFFEGFDRSDVAELAGQARIVAFQAGERVFAEGEPATALFLLISGAVELSFGGQAGQDGPGLAVQTITHVGHPIGWSAMVEPYAYRATATAQEATQLLALDRNVLDRQAKANPSFGVALMRAVLGVVGDRLRATRLRLVARRYDDVVVAIRDLLAQSTVQLSVTSPLHKLPHYLEHRLTLADAFHTLDLLQVHGDQVERDLAALCTDVLERVRQELRLYQQLQAIYQVVAGAPPSMAPEEVRRRSMLAFRRLFAGTRHRIAGWERLPERPGHIVIMNHLRNHPDNLLPNNFTLTLDTHFVASMILFERYGQAPVRVIRKSRPDEYGHQRFYDRLGYVYAYSGHVDAGDEDPGSSLEARRRFFLDAAGSCLRMGNNVIVCPEGANAFTEESPLRFRPGAFRLAAHVRPEPLLVPVAVANFDKKLTRTTTAAVVHEPFRLSEFVADPADERALLAFINQQLGPRFRGWVREAAALAGPSAD
jgi:CRP-like cAMP-binding protein/1-acyl-sn-glycerol-3-phosphate acyltransferase